MVAFAANVLSARATAVVAAPAVVVTSAVSNAPPERKTPTLIMTAKNSTTATVTGIHGLNLLRLLDQNEGCRAGTIVRGGAGGKRISPMTWSSRPEGASSSVTCCTSLLTDI